MALQPVEFYLDSPQDGWCSLVIKAGDEHHQIRCSQVYDPFTQLADFMLQLCAGHNGAIEIDEEGPISVIRIDREPGAFTGRLRVYRPSTIHGSVGDLKIDAEIDIVQFVAAYVPAFKAMADSYDDEEWDPEAPISRTGDDGETVLIIPCEEHHPRLDDIDLRQVEAYLRIYGALPAQVPLHPNEAEARAKYRNDVRAANANPIIRPDMI